MGLDSGPPGSAAVTCRHKEDAGTQDDVVSSLVELAGCDAQSTHEEQNHTQDGEDARGPHSPWRTRRVGERERQGYDTGVGGEDTGGRRESSPQEPAGGWVMDTGPEWRLFRSLREGRRGSNTLSSSQPFRDAPLPQGSNPSAS